MRIVPDVLRHGEHRVSQPGRGIWKVPEHEAIVSVRTALLTGDRSIDTARSTATERPFRRPRGAGVRTRSSSWRDHAHTLAPVILRWHLRHGVLTLFKSATPARMQETSQLFDFTLDGDDLRRRDARDRAHRRRSPHRKIPIASTAEEWGQARRGRPRIE